MAITALASQVILNTSQRGDPQKRKEGKKSGRKEEKKGGKQAGWLSGFKNLISRQFCLATVYIPNPLSVKMS